MVYTREGNKIMLNGEWIATMFEGIISEEVGAKKELFYAFRDGERREGFPEDERKQVFALFPDGI